MMKVWMVGSWLLLALMWFGYAEGVLPALFVAALVSMICAHTADEMESSAKFWKEKSNEPDRV